jgi:hypothetical protein
MEAALPQPITGSPCGRFLVQRIVLPDVLLLHLLLCAALFCRLLAEEDVAAGPGPISAAAGDDGAELYTAGGVEAAGFDAAKFNLYLVRKVRAGSSNCSAADVAVNASYMCVACVQDSLLGLQKVQQQAPRPGMSFRAQGFLKECCRGAHACDLCSTTSRQLDDLLAGILVCDNDQHASCITHWRRWACSLMCVRHYHWAILHEVMQHQPWLQANGTCATTTSQAGAGPTSLPQSCSKR